MSYNIVKLNNNPSIDESFTDLSLSSIIAVTDPTNGEFLTKSSSDWSTTTLTAQQIMPIYINKPYGSYNVGTYYYNQNDNYIIYKNKETVFDTTKARYLSATGSYVPVANSSWFQSFRLLGSQFNGKTVMFEASIAPYTSTTMRAEVQWVNGYTNSYTPIGPPSKVHGQGHADTVYGRFVGNGTDAYISLKFRYLDSSNSSRLSGGVRHQAEFVVIRIYD